MFVLFNFLIALGVSVAAAISHFWFLSGLFSLAVFLPGLAIAVRRLHDTNKTGLWLLVGFIPLIGWLIVLYFLVQPSSTPYGQAA